VQSHLYSLSFASRSDWSRQFPSRAEIQASLQALVEQHDLSVHIHLGTRLVRACWDEAQQRWEALDQRGGLHRAQWLISAVGGLSRPAWPDIEGLGRFKGRIIHSQQWPEGLQLSGKRVAVIGTGASAIQFVPHLQRRVKRLDIYQRSAQWILPKPDRAIPQWRRWLLHRLPLYRRMTRLGLFLLLESRLPAFTRFPKFTAFHRWKARRHLARQVSDPELRNKLTPDYAMGCKRVLMSSDYYPAVGADNVNLITIPIEVIREQGIVDRAGVLRECDLIILGTGFQASHPIPEGMIIGREGRDLAAAWDDGPYAYKGSTIPGFPNFVTLLGPNTALGHNSVLLMIEAQIRYLLSALKWAQQKRQRVVEVNTAAARAWNDDLQRRLRRSVWSSGGCSSWYQHPGSGRIPTLWPRFTFTFRWLLRRFDPEAYRFEKARTPITPDRAEPPDTR
jgi:cyclohexanone monooxygenase